LFISVIFIFFSSNMQVKANETQKYFSEMSEEECIAFLADSGIENPADFQNYDKIGDFVKETITAVEENSNISFTYNYPGTLDYSI